MKLGKKGFHCLIQPVDRSRAIFREDGYLVWCGTVLKGADEKYYMYYSRWSRELGHDAWVTNSEVAYAVSDSPYGGFIPQGIALPPSGKGWDANCVHNPTIIVHNGKYYMYYMGNYGNGEYWDHRNHQRVGLAIADTPKGPWVRFDKPIVDVTLGSFDHLLTSNPTVTRGNDGKFYMVYKAVANGPLPKGGAVICGVAIADSPEGPFVKQPVPVMRNPEKDWSVEDPYIWFQDETFYALVKDFQGYFTGGEKGSVALFESGDGINWNPAEKPFAFGREIHWDDGKITYPVALERPQLLVENGKPVVLYCAAADTPDRMTSYNVAIPLEWENLKNSDTGCEKI